jgi:molybdopterin/thiamine biosynthesis adenylyltransferase
MVSIQNKFFTLETMDFSFNPDLIVCAVDSMAVRELLWHLTVKHAPTVKWYVDTRMASRSLSVFVANLQDSDSCKQYENSIFPDAEAVQERCTAKAIIHTAYAAAYTVGNIVHDIVNNVPVYQAYHAELDKFRFVKSKAIININSQPQEEN